MSQLATFARVYVSDIDRAVALFSANGGARPRLRFSHPSGLELALIGEVLIVAGPEPVLEDFRATQVTIIVDDLEAAVEQGLAESAIITRGPADQPTGRNVTMMYPYGATVEYVEWNQQTRTQVGV